MKNQTRHLGRGQRLQGAFLRASVGFARALPMLVGVILLIGLFNTYITKQMLSSVFTGKVVRDAVVGTSFGSISAGNPITSYIIGGELLDEHVSLFAVTAFVVAWVTVGVIQLPAEARILGRRFAIVRNAISFLLAILVSLAAVFTLVVIA